MDFPCTPTYHKSYDWSCFADMSLWHSSHTGSSEAIAACECRAEKMTCMHKPAGDSPTEAKSHRRSAEACWDNSTEEETTLSDKDLPLQTTGAKRQKVQLSRTKSQTRWTLVQQLMWKNYISKKYTENNPPKSWKSMINSENRVVNTSFLCRR